MRAGAAGPRPDPLAPAGLFEGLALDGDEATGANIVKVALRASLKLVAVNAGFDGGVVAEEVRGLTAGEALDAATGRTYNRTRRSSRVGWLPATYQAAVAIGRV
jgi:hypothetical protein